MTTCYLKIKTGKYGDKIRINHVYRVTAGDSIETGKPIEKEDRTFACGGCKNR